MHHSQWHKFYSVTVAAPPEVIFELLSDMPNYQRWLPKSEPFSHTTAVDPYPVQLGSKYLDGRPHEPSKDWWGTVIGFQPPGSIDFHQTIRVTQLRATVDVHIHYSIESEGRGTRVNRWQVLDVNLPIIARPLRSVLISKIDQENQRILAAVKHYAETHSGGRARDTAPGSRQAE
jgi:carbon monoxide dehydrogenase subunit G